jgi:hypothetical protein
MPRAGKRELRRAFQTDDSLAIVLRILREGRIVDGAAAAAEGDVVGAGAGAGAGGDAAKVAAIGTTRATTMRASVTMKAKEAKDEELRQLKENAARYRRGRHARAEAAVADAEKRVRTKKAAAAAAIPADGGGAAASDGGGAALEALGVLGGAAGSTNRALHLVQLRIQALLQAEGGVGDGAAEVAAVEGGALTSALAAHGGRMSRQELDLILSSAYFAGVVLAAQKSGDVVTYRVKFEHGEEPAVVRSHDVEGGSEKLGKGDAAQAMLPCPALGRAFELFEVDEHGRVDLKGEGLL